MCVWGHECDSWNQAMGPRVSVLAVPASGDIEVSDCSSSIVVVQCVIGAHVGVSNCSTGGLGVSSWAGGSPKCT